MDELRMAGLVVLVEDVFKAALELCRIDDLGDGFGVGHIVDAGLADKGNGLVTMAVPRGVLVVVDVYIAGIGRSADEHPRWIEVANVALDDAHHGRVASS